MKLVQDRKEVFQEFLVGPPLLIVNNLEKNIKLKLIEDRNITINKIYKEAKLFYDKV